MASSSSKQLWEYLHEQQKPFALDVYISERRIMLNKSPKRSGSCNFNKRSILHSTKILKFILSKFMHTSHKQKISRSHKAHKHELILTMIEKHQQIRGTKRFSIVSSSVALRENDASILAGTSDGLRQKCLKDPKVATDTDLQWECKQNNNQSSLVSVLNNVPASNKVCHFLRRQEEESASTSSSILAKNAEEDSVLSDSLRELLIKSVNENSSHGGFAELQEVIGPASSLHPKNKRVLQQSKQLLFDCINEVTATLDRKNERKKCAQGFMSLDELGKIICEQICTWTKQNASQQASFDVSITVEDRDSLQQLSRKIGIEIGDAVMDEIIQELIHFFLP